ncbi:MAG TPA: DUF402 domain-containing protein [Longimicrobiales bacterium]|nr:DUF402 domain-containing protein [Longimicrobiales bacterium]
MRPGTPVEIEYHRAGAETLIYRQWLAHAGSEGIVTVQASTPIPDTKTVDDRPILAPGSPVVWFTFEGAWHDIGAFHLPDGTPTGHYANILTPVRLDPPSSDRWTWSTMDLCLDVWRSPDGAVRVLDEEELQEAERSGAVRDDHARHARDEAIRLVRAARNDEWPPALVGEWPLERAREVLSRAGVDLEAASKREG